MLPVCTILSIIQVKDLPLSFKTAKELRGRAELLPSGPRWQSMVIPTSFPTKSPVVLYWRDPLECIATILNNPLLHGLVDFVPYKEYSLPAMCWRYLESLMDFRYHAQAYVMDEDDLDKLECSLANFHKHKDSILAANARWGKGNQLIDNWYIPKLELMQNIAPSICHSGVAIQWMADVTEHAHIMEIKDPAWQSNNNNYDPQICQHLDRKEKLRHFDLATRFHQLALDAGAKEVLSASTEDKEDSDNDQESGAELENDKLSISFLALSRPLTDYFAIAKLLATSPSTAPTPLRSFSVGLTAFHLTSKPSVQHMSVQEATVMFQLPDLPAALSHFVAFEKDCGPSALSPVGGHRRTAGTVLPFDELQVWFKLHIQGHDFHRRDQLLPAQMLFCTPPSTSWPFG